MRPGNPATSKPGNGVDTLKEKVIMTGAVGDNFAVGEEKNRWMEAIRKRFDSVESWESTEWLIGVGWKKLRALPENIEEISGETYIRMQRGIGMRRT